MPKYQIIYDPNHPELTDSPAGCDRTDKLIVVNPVLFNELTPFQKKFILLHEEGHIALDTDNEISADAYAFDRLAGTEFRSLKQAVGALQQILDGSNPEHKQRYYSLYKRALKWDEARPITNKATGSLLDWIGITNRNQTELESKQAYNLKMSELWNFYNLNNNALEHAPDLGLIILLVAVCIVAYFIMK